MMRALLYPLLLALVFPFALAAENIDQGVRLIEILPVVIVSLVWGGTGHLLGVGLRLSSHRRALFAAAFVALLYCPLIARNTATGAWSPQTHDLFAALAGIAGACIAALWIRRIEVSKTATDFFFVLTAVLCLIPLSRLLAAQYLTTDSDPQAVSVRDVNVSGDADIWLLVFDAYGSPSISSSSYGVNLGGMISRLEEMGFFVPRNGRANYVNTTLSLAAMLNRRYLDPALDGLPIEASHLAPAARLIESASTIRDLKARGYEFVFFRSSFPPLSRNRLADRQIPERVASEFTRYWLGRTLIASGVRLYCGAGSCAQGRWPFQPETPQETRAKVSRILAVAGEATERPRFVFVHFLLPHGPFRYDSTCNPTAPVWPATSAEATSDTVRSLYANQLRCANELMLELVEGILRASSKPPAILIQGDHGYGRFAYGRVGELDQTSAEQVADRSSAFGAYLLPGRSEADPAPFWDGISPVNVLKVAFRSMFGSTEPYVPDRTYWSSWEHPYRFNELEATAADQ